MPARLSAGFQGFAGSLKNIKGMFQFKLECKIFALIWLFGIITANNSPGFANPMWLDRQGWGLSFAYLLCHNRQFLGVVVTPICSRDIAEFSTDGKSASNDKNLSPH